MGRGSTASDGAGRPRIHGAAYPARTRNSHVDDSAVEPDKVLAPMVADERGTKESSNTSRH